MPAVCAARSREAETAGAAMVMIMPPYHGATFRVGEPAIYEFYRVVSDAIGIPIMIQDAPVAGTPLSVDFLARMAKELANVRYFKIEVPMAANKLRGLIEKGGSVIEGPWDGEEAITLMADLDAGATGAMTGGGYPDGIRQIMDPFLAGRRDEAVQAYARWLHKEPDFLDEAGGTDIAASLPDAAELCARRETPILEIARSADFSLDKLKEALKRSAEIH